MELRTRYMAVDLSDARRRLAALVEIARWVWIVNAAVMVVGAYYERYDIAALAGFTWILSLTAAAIGGRVARSLGEVSEAARRR